MSLTEKHSSEENWLVAVGQIDPAAARTLLQLDSGRIVTLPTELLLPSSSAAETQEPESGKVTVIPVLAEELVISKRQVPIETVRLVKTTENIVKETRVALTQEHWEVSRVPINSEVAARSGVRYDGDTAIYPVYEERLITRKALFLVEEVHVQKRIETKNELIRSPLQRELLTVERIAPETDS